jgi:hypothetical protein
MSESLEAFLTERSVDVETLIRLLGTTWQRGPTTSPSRT